MNVTRFLRGFAFGALLGLIVKVLTGCGHVGGIETDPLPPITCTVHKTGSVSKLDCPDGTSIDISDGATGSQGPQGNSGSNGSNGQDGYSIVASTSSQIDSSSASLLGYSCSTGGTLVYLAQDSNRSGAYELSDSNQNVLVVCNGQQGQAGQNGLNGQSPNYVPVKPITPCGANSSPWKEVLLCLFNGQVLSSYSDNANGLNTRLSFIPNGSYQDTDNSGCTFTVTSNVNGTSVSWNAGSNSYSSWTANTEVCSVN